MKRPLFPRSEHVGVRPFRLSPSPLAPGGALGRLRQRLWRSRGSGSNSSLDFLHNEPGDHKTKDEIGDRHAENKSNRNPHGTNDLMADVQCPQYASDNPAADRADNGAADSCTDEEHDPGDQVIQLPQ